MAENMTIERQSRVILKRAAILMQSGEAGNDTYPRAIDNAASQIAADGYSRLTAYNRLGFVEIIRNTAGETDWPAMLRKAAGPDHKSKAGWFAS